MPALYSNLLKRACIAQQFLISCLHCTAIYYIVPALHSDRRVLGLPRSDLISSPVQCTAFTWHLQHHPAHTAEHQRSACDSTMGALPWKGWLTHPEFPTKTNNTQVSTSIPSLYRQQGHYRTCGEGRQIVAAHCKRQPRNLRHS